MAPRVYCASRRPKASPWSVFDTAACRSHSAEEGRARGSQFAGANGVCLRSVFVTRRARELFDEIVVAAAEPARDHGAESCHHGLDPD